MNSIKIITFSCLLLCFCFISANNGGKVVFRLDLKNFYPEGLAYDSLNDCFYMGSLVDSRIVKIASDGKVSDFITTKITGYTYVGLRVDVKRGVLWACSNSDKNNQTGISKFNLKTGKLIKNYLVVKKVKLHLFNDLAITREGAVYITSFAGGTVYTINPEGKIGVFIELGDKMYTNGITLSPDEKHLFMAANADILKINRISKKLKKVIPPKGQKLGYADGLYFYKGGLVAVQSYRINQKRTMRIAWSKLDQSMQKVTTIKILAQDHPSFRIPTTGALKGNQFYFIATSDLDKLDKKLTPEQEPKDVLIMKVNLH